MNWYDGLTFRSQKEIKTKGDLYRRCLGSYRGKTKGGIHSRVIADSAEISAGRLSNFIDGQWEDMPEGYLVSILASIEMPLEAFKTLAKKSAILEYGGVFAVILAPTPADTSVATPQPAMVSRIPIKTEENVTAPKRVVEDKVKAKPLKIKNHVMEGFLAMVDADGVIHLYENTPTTAKLLKKVKWSYVAPADEVGGELVARVSTL